VCHALLFRPFQDRPGGLFHGFDKVIRELVIEAEYRFAVGFYPSQQVQAVLLHLGECLLMRNDPVPVIAFSPQDADDPGPMGPHKILVEGLPIKVERFYFVLTKIALRDPRVQSLASIIIFASDAAQSDVCDIQRMRLKLRQFLLRDDVIRGGHTVSDLLLRADVRDIALERTELDHLIASCR
jgi:hypothetical protein